MNQQPTHLLLLLLALTLVAGCEYETAVDTKPTKSIDERLLGKWEIQDQDRPLKALVLKLSDKAYLFQYPVAATEGLYFRTTLTEVAGIPLLQIFWVGTVEGTIPEERRKYSLATYTVDGNEATIALVNSKVIPSTITNPQELKEAIERQKDNPDLFRETIRFKKLRD